MWLCNLDGEKKRVQSILKSQSMWHFHTSLDSYALGTDRGNDQLIIGGMKMHTTAAPMAIKKIV